MNKLQSISQGFSARLWALCDKTALLLIIPALAVLLYIDEAMFKTILQWVVVAPVLAGIAVMVSRVIYHKINLTDLVMRAKAGLWGPHAAAFDWTAFFVGATTAPFDYVDEDSGHAISTSFLIPKDPYLFVDNMLVNGMLLCKDHHVENSEGIHAMPHPLWIAQKYAVTGYQFSKSGQIHHGDPTHE